MADIEKTIVGTWVYPLTNETVEFKADGTLLDPQNSTIGGNAGADEPTQKTWEMNSSGIIEIQSSTISAIVKITINSFTCDEIMSAHDGFPRTMERR